ncbi:hypothetical protein, partial [Klebsiella pneumoniae]|uniref:hypothetical protein n=1 Tax=Klebsiella pneumoniae TaxID=573 RepID=UPI001CEDC0BB
RKMAEFAIFRNRGLEKGVHYVWKTEIRFCKKSRNKAIILIGLEREQTLMVSGCLLLPLDAGG